MSVEEQPVSVSWWRSLGEDWWSVIIGSLLIVLVLLGVIAGVPW